MKTKLITLLVAATASAASGGNTPLEVADLTRANLDRTGSQLRPAAATMADGTVLVAWERNDDAECNQTSSQGVYLRRIIPNSLATTETRIDDGTEGNSDIQIATGSTGNAAIAWERDARDGFVDGIYVRLLENATAALGPQIEISEERDAISDLEVLSDGRTLILIDSNPTELKLVAAPDEIVTFQFASRLEDERILPLTDGNWIILWTQSSGGLFSREQITGQYFSSEGQPGAILPPFDAGESLGFRSLDTVTLADGTHRIVWTGTGPQIPGSLNPTPEPTFIASRTVSADGSVISDTTSFTRTLEARRNLTTHPIPSGGYVAFSQDHFIRFDATDQPIGGFLPYFPGSDFRSFLRILTQHRTGVSSSPMKSMPPPASTTLMYSSLR